MEKQGMELAAGVERQFPLPFPKAFHLTIV